MDPRYPRPHCHGNLENIRTALKKLRLTPSYDAFARELRLNGAPIVDEVAFERLWTQIVDTCGWQPSRVNLHTVVIADAHARASHPVRAYLDQLTWDGVSRLDAWLVTYAGAEDTPYVQAVGALPLLAAVRRIRSPGAKFDELLIIESAQGTGKSSALRALCPHEDWFSDDFPLGVDAKHVIERHGGQVAARGRGAPRQSRPRNRHAQGVSLAASGWPGPAGVWSALGQRPAAVRDRRDHESFEQLLEGPDRRAALLAGAGGRV